MSRISFIEHAIQSAQNYYDYVDDNHGACITIHTYKVSRIKRNIFSLELSKPIKKDDEARMCLYGATLDTSIFSDIKNRYVDTKHFSIVESNSNGIIKLKVSDEIDYIMQNISCDDIKFISDLKFLIENVKKWYLDYGREISVPSPSNITADECFFQSTESDIQIEAVKNALSSNISYIWGPPGTGKTHIVLSDCVLSYIKRKEKVFLLAPTNNAVENMVRAIISSLQSKDEDIRCLYRMGISSKDFAKEYGEVCEASNTQKIIEELQQDIIVLQNKRQENIAAVKTLAECDKFNFAKCNYYKHLEIKDEYQQRHKSFQFELSQAIIQLDSFKKTLNEIVERQNKLQCRENSITFKLKNIFSKRELLSICEEKKQLKEKYNLCITQIQQLENNIKSLNFSIEQCIDVIHNTDCAISLSKKDAEEAATNVVGYFSDLEDIDDKIKQIYATVRDIQIDENIDSQIIEIDAQISDIKEQSEKTTNTKYVYAFTVDYLISHYKALNDLGIFSNVAHVFLDEAAYCPFIKAAPLFSFQVPVTLLGDHMQLPPICEASDNALAAFDNKLFLWDISALYFPQLFETDYSIEDIFRTYTKKTPPQSSIMSISILSTTFRFGNNLAKILDEFIYKTGFCGQTTFDTAITVIHANKRGNETQRRVNFGEIQAIKNYVLSNSLDDFAILTPYKNQKEQLINSLRGIVHYENISTIHAAQGKEWDTVIISVSDVKNMYFTNSLIIDGLYTMNTAISRARKNIVLVCNYDVWRERGEKQLIGRLVNNATELIRDMTDK